MLFAHVRNLKCSRELQHPPIFTGPLTGLEKEGRVRVEVSKPKSEDVWVDSDGHRSMSMLRSGHMW